jgi:5-methylcytosine-specific restriction endonuclease McrA
LITPVPKPTKAERKEKKEKWVLDKIEREHRLKEAILKRDDYKCLCRKPAETVHHIVERSVAPKWLRDQERNLISLCAEHHRLMHDHGTKARRRKLLLYMMTKFGYIYNEDIYRKWLSDEDIARAGKP